MEFRALRIPTLTEEVGVKLEGVLHSLPGVDDFSITLETQELRVHFDENQVAFRILIHELAKAGCSLKDIDAALLL
ncbi:MAG: hypothetical protein B6243_10590 [Anaerolineaceae bacterium 4572_5.2]|nr:MAG: hypothetical protein B6243_10590 [Anaerolineaceae bacterium 4572_5.2]